MVLEAEKQFLLEFIKDLNAVATSNKHPTYEDVDFNNLIDVRVLLQGGPELHQQVVHLTQRHQGRTHYFEIDGMFRISSSFHQVLKSFKDMNCRPKEEVGWVKLFN